MTIFYSFLYVLPDGIHPCLGPLSWFWRQVMGCHGLNKPTVTLTKGGGTAEKNSHADFVVFRRLSQQLLTFLPLA